MNETFEKVTIAVIGGIVGAILVACLNKNFDHRIEHKEEKLDKKIEQAEKSLDDISRKVDSAVKSVYDSEAKEAFKRRLEDVDLKGIAIKECERSMRDITDLQLKMLIHSEFISRVRPILEDETKHYFKDKVEGIAKLYLDEDYITRTAKAYIRSEVIGILETQTEKMLDSYDIDDLIDDYLDDHPIKVESAIKKVAVKAVKEKVDDLEIEYEDDLDDEGTIRISFG